MVKQVWVSPTGDDWKVKSAGAGKAAGIFENKAEAVAKAKEIAKNNKAELIVQKEDGTIGWKNSYGNDDYPPRG